ncbi:MAG TPA: NAD-dependent epimerase/dehydratase family protein [Proteobacteria bacterium]|nr:NAD-dependent epimerase/dehydratase family protein [Pseudomonadota bacterium]
MNCLVLGGAGFIGSHAVEALLAAGHQVRILERPACSLVNIAAVRDRVEVFFGDFTVRRELTAALSGIDLVLHMAGTVLPASSNLDPLFDIQSNLMGTVTLLEEAVRNGVKKVVFASSGGTVYGVAGSLPLVEEAPTEPLSSYGIVKLATEKYLKLFQHLYGLDYTILRIANPYGERQRIDGAQGAVAVFLGRLKRRQAIEIWGDGEIARDYLYISDLSAAILKACEKNISKGLFNIGGGRPWTLNEVLAELEIVSGRRAEVIYKPSRACDTPLNWLDCTRARQELDWEAQVDFREGLRRTWEWVSRQ